MSQDLAGTAELAFFGGARARSAPWLPASGAACGWTAAMGGGWLDYLERLEAMLAPVGASMLARAAFRSGERVLDVGSGLGGFSRQVAAALGSSGWLRGVDVSPAVVAEANRRACAEGASNVAFSVADAAVCRPQLAPFGRICSRLGTLYFAEPLAAMRNLHSLLQPGGRLDLAVWAPLRDNDWAAYLMGILRRHVDVPWEAPGEPGPFSLSSTVYLRELLAAAGFRNVDIQSWQGRLVLGGPGASVAEAAQFTYSGLFIDQLLRRQHRSVRETVQAQVEELFSLHQRPIGVTMSGAVWLVSAWRPY